MKKIFLALLTFFLFTECNNNHSHHLYAQHLDALTATTDSAFKAKRIARSATITCQSSPGKVFTIFGPVVEKEWAEGWDFHTIYSETNLVEEGFVFQTVPHKGDTQKTTWIISKYEPVNLVIEYILFSENLVTAINIKCSDNDNGTTDARISYTYTGLNERGNNMMEHLAEHMYAHNMKDWEEAINYYLKNNKMLQHEHG